MDEYIKRDGVLSKFNIDDMMNVNGTTLGRWRPHLPRVR